MRLPQRLPGPLNHLWDWQLRAQCRGLESAVFYSPDGERGHARARREARAKQLCQQCPVLAQCRAHALRTAEPFGVWGGLTEVERTKVLKAENVS